MSKLTSKKSIETQTFLPPMTEAYHRARRSYGFFCGLLIAWELVGVEVKEAPFQNFNIVLKSPHAVQYVLVVLVLYFAFRTLIEWYQSSAERRALKASAIDFTVAHSLGVVAIALYLIQRLLDLQIANVIAGYTFVQMIVSFVFGYSIARFIRFLQHQDVSPKHRMIQLITPTILLLFIFLGARSYNSETYLLLLVSALLGISLYSLLRVLWRIRLFLRIK